MEKISLFSVKFCLKNWYKVLFLKIKTTKNCNFDPYIFKTLIFVFPSFEYQSMSFDKSFVIFSTSSKSNQKLNECRPVVIVPRFLLVIYSRKFSCTYYVVCAYSYEVCSAYILQRRRTSEQCSNFTLT